MVQRVVAVLLHPARDEALEKAAAFIRAMHCKGFCFLVFEPDLVRVRERVPEAVVGQLGSEPAEVAVVFGGDGTMLRAAEWAMPLGVPLLGVNLGHVGFLAEMELSDLDELPTAIAKRRYLVERRLATRP